MFAVPRLLLPCALLLLAGCAHKADSFSLQKQSQCPLALHAGQTLILSLPSNPTTGFRWITREAAPDHLQSLGPEVYSNPEDAGLIGSAGISTWRYQATEAGKARLRLTYERPWETGVAPAEVFECALTVK